MTFMRFGYYLAIFAYLFLSGGLLAQSQSPYQEHFLPGSIEIEHYDLGGQGVAYYDASSGNSGKQFRNDDVDIASNGAGGYAVGWCTGTEWLEYTVEVSAGTYDINILAGSPKGGSLVMSIDGEEVGVFQVPNTGGYKEFTSVPLTGISISEGEHVLRLSYTGSGLFDLDRLDFSLVAPSDSGPGDSDPVATQSPYQEHFLPGSIEIEHYDLGGQGVAYYDASSGNSGKQFRNDDVDIASNGAGGYAVGWCTGTEWLEYTVEVSAGTYDINILAGSPKGGSLVMSIDGEEVGVFQVPNTGGYKEFTSVPLTGILISEGEHVLRLSYTGSGLFDLDRLNFSLVAPSDSGPGDSDPVATQSPYQEHFLPGSIEIEHYDLGGQGVAYYDASSGNSGKQFRNDDVDIASNGAGGYAVGWCTGTEWLEYTVEVSAGTYDINILAGSPKGGSLVMSIDGEEVGVFQVPNTGGYKEFTSVPLTGISISEGEHVLRLSYTGSGLFDLDRLDFSLVAPSDSDPDISDPDSQEGAIPIGVSIDWSSFERKAKRGDNWCMTWASDGNLYTMMDDGSGFDDDETMWNNQLIQISGGPDFTVEDTKECIGWPYHPNSKQGKGFYGYGTYAVGQRIYSWIWKSDRDGYGPPIANRLVYTDDFGETVYRWDGVQLNEENHGSTEESSFFFYKEQPKRRDYKLGYAFNWLAFCQNGQANSQAEKNGDPYVYMYANEQWDSRRLGMIRVHKDQVVNKESYEYLVSVDESGNATWSSNMEDRGTTHIFEMLNYNGLHWIWCSWHPSVVYNEALDRYIMVSYGLTDYGTSYWASWCTGNSENSSTVKMLHSKNPWGPWTEFYHQVEWKVPEVVPPEWGFTSDASRTYQFKLNPKWISEDGKSMWLHWSDAGGKWDEETNGHSRYWYRWNQVKIDLELISEAEFDSNG